MEQLKLRHVPTDMHKKYLDPLLAKLNDPTNDGISHFVLRLAYCRTEDLRRWFLAQEVALLKWRLGLSAGSARNLKAVLPESAKLVEQEELEALKSQLLSGTAGITLSKLGNFYQVPFTHALDLVQHRQVFVKKGMAYIPESKLVHLVTAKFRTHLSRQLVLLAAVPTTPGLKRTQGFLKNVATIHAVKDEFTNKDEMAAELTAHNVQAHLRHMPLCMAQLQLAVQTDRHLKHWGRLQYGLFLKGAGLSLEDALLYFERMFTGKTKDFSKEYAYNFRHMYGKEGKRANYPPYSCSKVINSNAPNANEHHGCPYKHSTVQHVTGLLTKLGVQPQEQKAIIAQQQSHNYQLACMEHFKVVHPAAASTSNTSVDNVGNHPNAWFHASVAYHKANSKEKKPSAMTPGAKGAASLTEPAATAVSP
jgi:DNA primase large subunit